jgi:integrase
MIGFIAAKFSGHLLRAGLASFAEVDERYVQKQLGHVSAEMTRRYQRRHEGGVALTERVLRRGLG